jgi:Mce-associated membrane protein
MRASIRPERGMIGWALVAAAVVFLAWSSWAVWRDGSGERSGPDRTRDAVLASAGRQIAALNTMDPAHVDAGLQAWLDASTGALREQLERDRAQNRVKIGQSETSAAATVTGAAVTSLDVRAGKAKVIASVQVKLALRDGSPTLQRKRFEAGTARTPSGWRLESLTAIPAGAR